MKNYKIENFKLKIILPKLQKSHRNCRFSIIFRPIFKLFFFLENFDFELGNSSRPIGRGGSNSSHSISEQIIAAVRSGASLRKNTILIHFSTNFAPKSKISFEISIFL